MENVFKFDNVCIDDAIKNSKKAISYSEGVNANLDKLNNLAEKVKIDGLNYGNINSIKTIISDIPEIESNIVIIKNEGMRDLLATPDFQYKLVQMVIAGNISSVDAVTIANEYMKNLVKTNPNYYKTLKEAKSIHDVLRQNGFEEEFIDSLNGAFCENLIRNNKMYTREGVVEMAYSFNGLLAMFGYKLDYSSGTGNDSYFDNIHHGLYLGTKNIELKMLDCCNYYDWLARCAGIDMYAYGAYGHYQYGKDLDTYANRTPKEEYWAQPKDEYFYKGRPGDILETNERGHLRVIVERTATGYLTTEESGSMYMRHYTFEELAKSGYHVSNMDAVYRNTTSGLVGIHRNHIPAGYQEEVYEARETRGEGIFFSPRELAKELNLRPALENELIKQYNARNKYPGAQKLQQIAVPNNEQIVVPDIEETTPEEIPEINETIKQEENTSTNSGNESSTKPPVNSGNESSTKPSVNSGNESSTKPPVNSDNESSTKPPVNSGNELSTKPPVNSNQQTGTINRPVINILPENKFSDGLPGLSGGTLGSMEISQSFVSYEIHNVSNNTYDNYIQSLLDKGYVMNEDGTYTNGTYNITTTIADNGNMSITLNIINK